MVKKIAFLATDGYEELELHYPFIRLKEAGYEGKYEDKEGEEVIKIPNLSELIEACGDEFGCIIRGLDGKWYVTSYPTPEKSIGDRPEEAVAKLWLKLQ